MERVGRATHLRRGYGAPSIEGKVTRVGVSERGAERVSIRTAPYLDTR
jgi:hypothetical protein